MSDIDILFESFAKLIYRFGNPPKSPVTNGPYSPDKIFTSWLNHLKKPFPIYTGKHLFRLLFPHIGSRRRYGLKEQNLAQELSKILGSKTLNQWDSVRWDDTGDAGTGCLGHEIEVLAKNRSIPGNNNRSLLTISELDTLLDELAASSSFSQLSQLPDAPRPIKRILTILYCDWKLSPYALSVLTQIILRDLRPLKDPIPCLPIRNPTSLLRIKTNNSPSQLSLKDAMMCWDRRMWDLYNGGYGNVDLCADVLERNPLLDPSKNNGPIIGVNVAIPKCKKGRSLRDAMKEFSGTRYAAPSKAIWAETKYDGYRLQIHVEVQSPYPRITIFSKSTRDSTQDRLNTHAIICHALSLPVDPNLPIHRLLPQRIKSTTFYPQLKAQKSVILEAEVVPFNENSREGDRGPGIEEFWWLGHAGVSAGAMNWAYSGKNLPSISGRHLCLIFFDILHIDGQGLLNHTYEERRKLLEDIIMVIPGFSQLAESTKISLQRGPEYALGELEAIFKRSNNLREEGLVLKAAESTYINTRWQWVKLKKDYIPNLGDCIDLVLLGAGWDIDRARELQVDTSVFTTFYVGVLTNAERVKSRCETPHFEILFRVSYGCSRDELEVYNENIRLGRWKNKPFDKDDVLKRRLIGLSWTYSLQRGMTPPSVLFEKPMCVEVMGAGFQKLPASELYDLRWPRLQKIYEPRERQWTEALSALSLISTAHSSLGYKCLPASSYGQNSPRFQDSIDAAWRSASHLNITDIPDLPSPSPKSHGQKRSKSEADLTGCRVKDEPLTPRPSPLRQSAGGREEVIKWEYTEMASKRLWDAMAKGEGIIRGSGTEISPVGYPQAAAATAAIVDRSIPSKRRRLSTSTGLSLATTSSEEKEQSVKVQDLTFLTTAAGQSTGESLAKTLSKISGIVTTAIAQRKAKNPNVQRWGKPFSLKSRIKLAMRQARKVS
ncbi:hypothetical protein C351_03239 [Cryptococcus neoformans c8]|nr:hypothetical protein C353_03514 [Cryptococcus neoformans var. grubii AD1-83a]OXG58984.1 hypothetical protein C354_03451 [Cryptococcus neoformans var. grubii MW-RSA1955]OXG63561.1 hypothetical protein C351_03239 [Cryptococcus neoformans var. grubii c8]OXG63770.1 hypothetical protein C352_03462 [Cryptococcus neoformans var. grubii CHC193]OXH10275.1 hypothetical protein C369_03489 [Cryptococcus neoformans var. grubii A5-35-17]OXH11724.1 hypothetical protein C370_03504 [Cryptococcus neoformans 